MPSHSLPLWKNAHCSSIHCTHAHVTYMHTVFIHVLYMYMYNYSVRNASVHRNGGATGSCRILRLGEEFPL